MSLTNRKANIAIIISFSSLIITFFSYLWVTSMSRASLGIHETKITNINYHPVEGNPNQANKISYRIQYVLKNTGKFKAKIIDLKWGFTEVNREGWGQIGKTPASAYISSGATFIYASTFNFSPASPFEFNLKQPKFISEHVFILTLKYKSINPFFKKTFTSKWGFRFDGITLALLDLDLYNKVEKRVPDEYKLKN